MAYHILGQGDKPDTEAYKILTGSMDYVADHMPGKKLFTRTLGSPYPHCKITSIDTSAAQAYPGVGAVITYLDCPAFNQELKWWGQEVAAVAAVDVATAARATQLIKVQYQVLPFVTDPDAAAQSGAPNSGTYTGTNQGGASTTTRGNVDTAFSSADVVIQGSVNWTNYFQVLALEPHAALANWLNDELYLWVSAQSLANAMSYVSGYLGMPTHKIHMYSHGTGGGFGEKWFYFQQAVMAAVLAKKAAQPVVVHLSRRDNFIQRGTHYAHKITSYKLGAKTDGSLVAADFQTVGDVNSSALSALDNFRQTYKCGNVRINDIKTATNKPWTTAWRGPPDHSGCFQVSVMMVKLAEKLGMDPLQLEYKNLVTPDLPDQDTGLILASNSVKQVYDTLATEIGWSQKWHAPGANTLADGRKHGIGIHAHISKLGQNFSAWGFADCGSMVLIKRDGKALLNLGITRCHQNPTTQCYIAAQALGMTLNDVGVGRFGETDVEVQGGDEGGSSRTITLGAATMNAALEARRQAFAFAATILKVTADTLDAQDSNIFSKVDPTITTTYAKVMAASSSHEIAAVGYSPKAVLTQPYLGFPIGTPAETRTMPGSAYEVAVDTDTGEVEILKVVSCEDVGTMIYPTGLQKEMEGGQECQVRQVLHWENIFDNNSGAFVNPNFIDFKVPTIMDLPDYSTRDLKVIESNDAIGPYGAKGVGEPACIPIAGLAQAIYNAIGVWPDLPFNPIHILKALGKG